MSESLSFRSMAEADWPDVKRIYGAGISTGQATFEAAPPSSWAAFTDGKHPWLMLVALEDVEIVGWAAASSVSKRDVYRGVIEHSVYTRPDARGRGIGRQLLDELVRRADEAGI